MVKVTVLLSTYNGEKYLCDQINSLIKQEGVSLSILVRDDGSRDNTINILKRYKSEGLLSWYKGDNLGTCRSFFDLIKKAPESDFYAFCDQDDVWDNNKLLIAVQKLSSLDYVNKPCLYCSNYQLVDSNLSILKDNHHVSTTTFNESMVASNCTGCTVVFNKRLLELLQLDSPRYVVMHDDWAHKVCLAVGGVVIYDPRKTLKYRQHGNNVDGGIHSFRSRVIRIYHRIISKERIRSKQIGEIMRIYGDQILPENYAIANEILNYYKKNLISRIKLAFSSRIRTPYYWLNRGFAASIIMKYY